MRQGSNNGRRPRGRTNRKQHGGGPSRPHTFDSNGPDGRVRGNARQVYEKYLTLARDAQSAGDRIAAEAYYQHAEHYFRILSDTTDPQRPDAQRSDGQRSDRRQDTRNDSRTAAEAAPAPHVNGEAEETTAEALLTDQPAETRSVEVRSVEVRSAEVAPENDDQHQNGSAAARNGQDAETLMAPAGGKSDEEEAAPKPAPKRRGRPRKARSSDQESTAAKDAAPKDSASKESAAKDTGDGASNEVESDPASA